MYIVTYEAIVVLKLFFGGRCPSIFLSCFEMSDAFANFSRANSQNLAGPISNGVSTMVRRYP